MNYCKTKETKTKYVPSEKKSVVTGFYYITQMKVMGNEFMASVDFIYLKIFNIFYKKTCAVPHPPCGCTVSLYILYR